MQDLEKALAQLIFDAAQGIVEDKSCLEGIDVDWEKPRDEEHGDLATNFIMRIAKEAKTNPRDLGQKVLSSAEENIKNSPLNSSVQQLNMAGPGFLNIKLQPNAWHTILHDIQNKQTQYGSHVVEKKKNILVEYVSANPTGPLTIAHGRQAALGDSLVRIMKFAGHDAKAEYYNNDSGVQINMLGISLRERCLEVLGETPNFPENGYKGQYLKDMAIALCEEKKGKAWLSDKEEATKFCSNYAKKKIMATIQKDLSDFGVHFDQFYSQDALDQSGDVEKTLEALKDSGYIYEFEGAVWLKTTDLGDDKDRVIIKSDKNYTYLMPDIAYHHDKFKRGFDQLVDILGPDHHGYIARLKASQKALGHDPEAVRVIISQLVTLFEGKEKLSMSTRAGEFITLRELMNEVGNDAARFFFILRKCESHLDFDLKLAKTQSSDNPVFYIQYVHARIASIQRKLKEEGVEFDAKDIDLKAIDSAEEIRLIKNLRYFSKAIGAAADQTEPHILVEYLTQLAASFHQFYQKQRVAVEDVQVAKARLMLVDCVKIVICNGLTCLGVQSPEKM